MMEKGVAVTINGKDYRLVLTVAALFEITEKYGGVTEMAAGLETGTKQAFDDIAWLVSLLADQGTMLATCKTTVEEKNRIDWAACYRTMEPHDIIALANQAMDAISLGMGVQRKQQAEDGPVDVVLEELEAKNAEGAAE